MIVKVVGKRVLDFTTDKNESIKGTKYFVLYKSDKSSDFGEVADSVFVKEGSPIGNPKVDFGKEYDFVYECAGLGGRSKLVSIKNKDGSDVKQEFNDSPFTGF